jgi:hypothetical protein
MAATEAAENPGTPLALPVSVRAVMENLIVGDPLKEEAERQARSQSWRPH